MRGTLSTAGKMGGSLAGASTLSASLTVPSRVPPPTYEGEYIVTPGDEEIVLDTQGLVMAHPVVITPVPSSYGRIIWDGHVLTVR